MPIRKWQLATKIATLRCPGPKQFIVAAPAKPGLQTCIIREVKSGYTRISDVKDALVYVPAGCREVMDPFPDPEFAGYLAIANEQYKKDIERALRRLPAGSPRSPQQSSAPTITKIGEAKANPRWKEHWLIVAKWSGWESQEMTLSQRFDQHCWNQGKIPPGKGVARKKAMQRFRAICRTINMPPRR